MKTAVSFQTVVKWFAIAQANAAAQGKSESATLWKDGLEHLQVMCAERDAAWRALEMACEVIKKGDSATARQREVALTAARKVLKATGSEAA